MNKYVLATSVSMRWLLASQQMEDQKYSEDILFSLSKLFRQLIERYTGQ